MKKLLAVVLPAALALVAIVTTLDAFKTRGAAAEARLERARLKRDFTERAGVVRALPPAAIADWRDEVQALSRWYVEELAGIRNRHPAEPARPSGLDAATKDEKRKVSDQDRAMLEEFQKYADGRWALLKDGRYAALHSAVDGALRLDLIAAESAAAPEGGGPGLRIDFALWGVPRYVERERDRDRVTTRSVVPVVLKRLAFRFLDDKGKQYGEMNGPGEPYLKLADPERFVDDFPPGVLFGTWWVDLFPREAVTVEIEVEAAARGASGTERPALFRFAMPVPETWKIPPGATYQADVREASAP